MYQEKRKQGKKKKSLIGRIGRDSGARSQRNLIFLEGGDGSKGVEHMGLKILDGKKNKESDINSRF